MILEFDYNKDFNWCEAEISLETENQLTEVIVKNNKNKTVREAGEIVLKWYVQNRESILKEISNESLINLKNDYWLDENEEELTVDDFVNNISLQTLVVDEDNSIELWLTDGDIFLGHCIYSEYTLDYQFIFSEMK